MYNKAIFLDRDGVINQTIIKNGKPYPPSDFNEFEILPSVKQALQLLHEDHYLLIVVTNQPDVGDKKQKQETVESFHQFLLNNFPLKDIVVCFDRNSFCYKPKPGMILNSAKKHNINCKKSYMIGDRWVDIEAGKAAGCKTVFIDYKYQEALK
ncbi:MAG: Histidinol-phosphate phosphatase family protein, partial [uncultured bacterium]